MFGKSVYLLGFLVSIAIVANAAPQYLFGSRSAPTEYIIGERRPGDRFISGQSYTVPKKNIFQKVTSDKTFSINESQEITMIRLVDRSKSGNGASAEVTGGGPGFNKVTVYFKSRTGHGIKYYVELYGRAA